jgi:hypothetical protein
MYRPSHGQHQPQIPPKSPTKSRLKSPKTWTSLTLRNLPASTNWMIMYKTANGYCVNEVCETLDLRFLSEVKASGQSTRMYHKPRYAIRAEQCNASLRAWLRENTCTFGRYSYELPWRVHRLMRWSRTVTEMVEHLLVQMLHGSVTL